ncbi:RNA polymerase sigma factor [Promicromonospora thailandica]|uniref:RNA polymerase, sigma subunit, ECF family n=1 Tax=Promicromonospora thailandica TaxID=765201 RepID=A0A9X2G510_9MICO|nr:RNA polymerase sigma factor [Promicromonospora thailandica]MCP2266909.1 RNA polymerase, sigma subunit, ECF family [Promicromonospora thailandica]BFF16579.1 hypothetical protein GCM10025730_01000 [Promicromonospora thailandica]
MTAPAPPPPEARFTALFESTHRALLAYAVRRVAEPEDAADVVAESFLVAWRRIDDVPAGADARPWMFGVARRVLANARRGDRRRLALADRLRAELAVAVETPPEPDRDVERALARLSDDDQELLRLVAWEELGREEIAVALGVSRTAVRVRLHRARRRLAEALAALAVPDDDVAAVPATVDDRPAVKRSGPDGQVMGRWARAHHGIEEAR